MITEIDYIHKEKRTYQFDINAFSKWIKDYYPEVTIEELKDSNKGALILGAYMNFNYPMDDTRQIAKGVFTEPTMSWVKEHLGL